MNRKQGLAKLKQMHGARAMYREDMNALVGEKRAAALSEIPALRAKHDALAESLKARRQAVLAADAEYQSLLAASKAALAEYEEVRPAAYRRRVTVGYSNGLGFHVEGEGDNWQEAIDAACKKSGRA